MYVVYAYICIYTYIQYIYIYIYNPVLQFPLTWREATSSKVVPRTPRLYSYTIYIYIYTYT